MQVVLVSHSQINQGYKSELANSNIDSLDCAVANVRKIKPTTWPDAANLILTSSLAIPQIPSKYFSLPTWCVGKSTADAAFKHGFNNINIANGNAASLAQNIVNFQQGNPAQNWLHVCGAITNKDPESTLLNNNINYKKLIVYEMQPLSKFSQKIMAAILSKNTTVFVFLSQRMYDIFISICIKENLIACLKEHSAFYIAHNISQLLQNPTLDLQWGKEAVLLGNHEMNTSSRIIMTLKQIHHT